MTSLTLAVDLFAVAKGFPVRLPYKRDPTLHMIMTPMVSLMAPVSLVAHVSLGLGLEPKKPLATSLSSVYIGDIPLSRHHLYPDTPLQ